MICTTSSGFAILGLIPITTIGIIKGIKKVSKVNDLSQSMLEPTKSPHFQMVYLSTQIYFSCEIFKNDRGLQELSNPLKITKIILFYKELRPFKDRVNFNSIG